MVRTVIAAAVALAVGPNLAGCSAAESAQEGTAQEESAGSVQEQVSMAVLPLPEAVRAEATVLGYAGNGALTTLRQGEGLFTCLADDPADVRFHVACYHRSLEPYMARGRELRALGMDGRPALQKRWEEARAGELELPRGPVALHSLSGSGPPAGGGDGELERLTVLYVPYATPEEVGLPTSPDQGLPWLMFPGRPTAHIMIHD